MGGMSPFVEPTGEINLFQNHRFFAGLLMVTLVSGCGTGVQTDYSKLGLVEVSGNVTLDGQPLSGATIMFEAPDSTYSFGTTDSNGYYEMMLNSEKSGVIPGSKTVRIVTGAVGDMADEGEGEEDAEEAASSSGAAVPPCYNEKSKIEIEVETSTTFDFDLKSDCSTTGPV